jgi:hypothetical protein
MKLVFFVFLCSLFGLKCIKNQHRFLLKNKTDLLLGFTIGIITSVFGCFLFIQLFTKFTFIAGVELLQADGKLGKIITLGTVLDLVLFWGLLKLNKEFMARGVILAVITLTLITLLV